MDTSNMSRPPASAPRMDALARSTSSADNWSCQLFGMIIRPIDNGQREVHSHRCSHCFHSGTLRGAPSREHTQGYITLGLVCCAYPITLNVLAKWLDPIIAVGPIHGV